MQMLMAMTIERCFVTTTQSARVAPISLLSLSLGHTGWLGNSGVVLTRCPYARIVAGCVPLACAILGNGDALCILAVSKHPLRHHRCGGAAELEGTAARESLTGVEWR
jgi:hypothetical protein